MQRDLTTDIPKEIIDSELATKLSPFHLSQALQVSHSWNSIFGPPNSLAWKRLIERDFDIPIKTLNWFEQLAKTAETTDIESWYEDPNTIGILEKPISSNFKTIYKKLAKFHKMLTATNINFPYHTQHLPLLALCTGNNDIINQFISDDERDYFKRLSIYFDCPHVYSYFNGPLFNGFNIQTAVQCGALNLVLYYITPNHRFSHTLDIYPTHLNDLILRFSDELCIHQVIQNWGLDKLFKDNELYYYYLNEIIQNKRISLSFIHSIILKMSQFELRKIYLDHLFERILSSKEPNQIKQTLVQLVMDEIPINDWSHDDWSNHFPSQIHLDVLLQFGHIDLVKKLLSQYRMIDRITTSILMAAYKTGVISEKTHDGRFHDPNPFLGDGIDLTILNDILSKNLYPLFVYLCDEKNIKFIPHLKSKTSLKILLHQAAGNPNAEFLKYLLENRERLNIAPDTYTLSLTITYSNQLHFDMLLKPEYNIRPTLTHLKQAIVINNMPMIRTLVENYQLIPTDEILELAFKPRFSFDREVMYFLNEEVIQYLLAPKFNLRIMKSYFFDWPSTQNDDKKEAMYRSQSQLCKYLSKVTLTQNDLDAFVRDGKFIFAKHILNWQSPNFQPTITMLELAIQSNNFDFVEYLLQRDVRPNTKFVLKILPHIINDIEILRLLLNPVYQLEFDEWDFTDANLRYDYIIRNLLLSDTHIRKALIRCKKGFYKPGSDLFAHLFEMSHKYSPLQCIRVVCYALANPSAYNLSEEYLSIIIDLISSLSGEQSITENIRINHYLMEASEQLRINKMYSLSDQLSAILIDDREYTAGKLVLAR